MPSVEHDHVVDVGAAAEAILRPPRGVRVVLDRDGRLEPRFQLLLERLVVPVDVRRVDDDGTVAVDEPCGGHTHRGDFVRVGEVADHVDHGIFECLRIDRRLDAELLDDVPFVVHHTASDLGSADVDSDLEH